MRAAMSSFYGIVRDQTRLVGTATGVPVDFARGWDALALAAGPGPCVLLSRRGVITGLPVPAAPPPGWTTVPDCRFTRAALCTSPWGMVMPTTAQPVADLASPLGEVLTATASRDAVVLAPNTSKYDLTAGDLFTHPSGLDVLACPAARVVVLRPVDAPFWVYTVMALAAIWAVRSLTHLVLRRIDAETPAPRDDAVTVLVLGVGLFLALAAGGIDGVYPDPDARDCASLVLAYAVAYLVLWSVQSCRQPTTAMSTRDPLLYNLIVATLAFLVLRVYRSPENPYAVLFVWMLSTRAIVKVRAYAGMAPPAAVDLSCILDAGLLGVFLDAMRATSKILYAIPIAASGMVLADLLLLFPQ